MAFHDVFRADQTPPNRNGPGSRSLPFQLHLLDGADPSIGANRARLLVTAGNPGRVRPNQPIPLALQASQRPVQVHLSLRQDGQLSVIGLSLGLGDFAP
jgi:hypothetical protein